MPEFNQEKALEVLTPPVQELQNNKDEQALIKKPQTLKEIKKEFREYRKQYLDKPDKGGNLPKTLPPLVTAKKIMEVMSVAKIDKEDGQVGLYNPDRGIYEVSDYFINRIIYQLEPSYSQQRTKEVIFKLDTLAEVKNTTAEPYLVPVKNGIFDKKKQKLLPFSPNYIFTSTIATAYNPNAVSPVINDWEVEAWLLDLIDGDEELNTLLWQIISASLNGNYSYRKGIWLLGNGNDGKGTFQDLIKNVVGIDNVCSLKAEQFEGRFNLSTIAGNTVIIGDESQVGYLDNAGNYFSVVTGDVVQVEAKGKQPYASVFRKLSINSTNSMPAFRNKSNGTYRRLLIVPFGKTFDSKTDNWNIKDFYIARKDVLEYVLKKALSMDFKKFIEPKATKKQLEEFRVLNDTSLAFLEEWMPQFTSNVLPTSFLSSFYMAWAKDGGLKPVTKRQFELKLPDHLKGQWERKTTRTNGRFNVHTDISKGYEFGLNFNWTDEQNQKLTKCMVKIEIDHDNI